MSVEDNLNALRKEWVQYVNAVHERYLAELHMSYPHMSRQWKDKANERWLDNDYKVSKYERRVLKAVKVLMEEKD